MLTAALLGLAAVYGLLLIPEPGPDLRHRPERQPFAWNQDPFWSALETAFTEARTAGCDGVMAALDATALGTEQLLDRIAASRLEPADPMLGQLETNLFGLAPQVAACPAGLPRYSGLVTRAREVVKAQSRHWDLNAPATRDRLYRLLYGSRTALEEAMLQAPPEQAPVLTLGTPSPSATPQTNVLGVALHSGDILVSRGGAATSALISRGNDYPGNFSHVALVHVSESNRACTVIEAHIESGVSPRPLAAYLADKKLRVMVLRLRPDLPSLTADPQLPHKAATWALREATARHIPYDFAMDHRDPAKQFCSEVASAAYRQAGVTLWMGVSHISAPGVVAWLGALGVRHFETQEPCDLEYDPQLHVVAEWRNRETLFKDRADNAVIDVMLEHADAGEALAYSRPMLPLARLGKAWSVLLNRLGRVGPIPEGMSATTALRVRRFSERHAALTAQVLARAAEFQAAKGYPPLYWNLRELARQAKTESRDRL